MKSPQWRSTSWQVPIEKGERLSGGQILKSQFFFSKFSFIWRGRGSLRWSNIKSSKKKPQPQPPNNPNSPTTWHLWEGMCQCGYSFEWYWKSLAGPEGARGVRPLVQFLSFSYSFRQKSCQITMDNRFLLQTQELRGLAPPAPGNSGFATGNSSEYSPN